MCVTEFFAVRVFLWICGSLFMEYQYGMKYRRLLIEHGGVSFYGTYGSFDGIHVSFRGIQVSFDQIQVFLDGIKRVSLLSVSLWIEYISLLIKLRALKCSRDTLQCT